MYFCFFGSRPLKKQHLKNQNYRVQLTGHIVSSLIEKWMVDIGTVISGRRSAHLSLDAVTYNKVSLLQNLSEYVAKMFIFTILKNKKMIQGGASSGS